MYVSWHVGLTTPLAGALAMTDPAGAALFWAGGVLIDTDHYIDHVYFNRNWSLKRAYWWHINYGEWLMRHPSHRGLCVFHTLEAMGLIALGSWFLPVLSYLFWGMVFHLILDKIHDYRFGCFWTRAYSLVQWGLWARKTPLWAMTEEMLEEEARARTGKKTADRADLIEVGTPT